LRNRDLVQEPSQTSGSLEQNHYSQGSQTLKRQFWRQCYCSEATLA